MEADTCRLWLQGFVFILYALCSNPNPFITTEGFKRLFFGKKSRIVRSSSAYKYSYRGNSCFVEGNSTESQEQIFPLISIGIGFVNNLTRRTQDVSCSSMEVSLCSASSLCIDEVSSTKAIRPRKDYCVLSTIEKCHFSFIYRSWQSACMGSTRMLHIPNLMHDSISVDFYWFEN